MSPLSLEEDRLKEVFKQALTEIFQERQDLLYELFAEALEDFALVRAIKESESDDNIGRDEIFEILEGEA